MIGNIETTIMQPTDLSARLDRHPVIKARMIRLLDLVDNVAGDLQRADDAEQRAIDELRDLGQEVLSGWAEKQASQTATRLEESHNVVRQVKKKSIGTAHSVRSKSPSRPT